MSKNDEKDEFELHLHLKLLGNVMDKAGLNLRRYDKRRPTTLNWSTHTHLTQAYKNMEFMNSPAARHILYCVSITSVEVPKRKRKGTTCSSVA